MSELEKAWSSDDEDRLFIYIYPANLIFMVTGAGMSLTSPLVADGRLKKRSSHVIFN